MPATAAQPGRLRLMAADIKLSHSVFAMPFALLAAFLAAGGFPGWGRLGLIAVCMIFARTFAMLANRYTDREIDARNPRTAGRALPSGRLKSGDVVLGLVLSGGGLLLGAAAFGVMWGNFWPLMLSPLVLAWLGAYGLMKRYTLLCHFFLGAALGISPLAAGVAIEPNYLTESTLWWLAGFVLLWVGGFDIIYGLQDIEVDQREGLHSIPARLGRPLALLTSKAAHLAALGMLIAAGMSSEHLQTLFKVGVGTVGLLLIVEHRLASQDRFSMAFFTVNGVISLLLGALGIADVVR